MKQTYTALLLLFCTSFAYAQKDFRKGYVVQNTDTLRGYVDYRGDNRSALMTTFKAALDGEERKLTPENIHGYGFENENKVFESKLVSVVTPDGKAKTKLFLNKIVSGKASIYYYRDSYLNAYFYLQKDTAFVELQNNKSELVDAATKKTYERYDKKYIGVLTYSFSDCPSITVSQLNNVRFTHSDLTRIAVRYNACVMPQAAKAAAVHREQKVKITIGPVLALTQTALKFTGERALGNADLKNNSHIAGGVSANITLPGLNEKMSLQTELLYVPAKFTSSTVVHRNYYYDFEFDLAYIKLPAQLRYTYPKGLTKPFVNAGIVMGYALKDTNKQSVLHESQAGSPPAEAPAINDYGYNSALFGFTAGTGLARSVQNKLLSLELRYELNSGITKLPDLKSSMNSFNLLLGYGF